MTPPTLENIRAAQDRIGTRVHRTPVMTSRQLDQRAVAKLFFKCENLQRAGAFKIRGATNAVLSLSPEEAARGVCTHSSGNHAAALALAARERGIPAHVVMPEDSSPVKVAAVRGYGGQIAFCAPTLEARESIARAVLERTGATFIHPFDDPRIIAGQGTAALELLDQVPDLAALVAPLGGGGLLSGCAIAAKGLNPEIAVWGVEPAWGDDGKRSLASGRIEPVLRTDTIADGLRTSLCPLTFDVIQRHVTGIATVTEDEITQAMELLFERMKLVVEPSAAVGLAAMLSGSITPNDGPIGIVLSGGNVDLRSLPWK